MGIRSSKTRPTDIVLTDYGTCGPDQIEQNGADKHKYAATSSHLPANRINKDDGLLIIDGDNKENVEWVSAVGTDSSKASTSKNSQPRTTGNADDLFALGITGIELLLAENKATLDCQNSINTHEYPINQLLFMCNEKKYYKQRLEFYKSECPKLVEFLEKCIIQDSTKRTKTFDSFKKSDYYKELEDQEENLKIKAQLFLAVIPDGDSLPTNEEIINEKSESWCDRVMEIKYGANYPQNTLSKDERVKILLTYFNENIEPYFCNTAAEYFKKELLAFAVREDSLCDLILQMIDDDQETRSGAEEILQNKLTVYFAEKIKPILSDKIAELCEKQLLDFIEKNAATN